MKICNHKCIMEVFLVYYTLHYRKMHSLDCKRNITLQYNKVSLYFLNSITFSRSVDIVNQCKCSLIEHVQIVV